MDLPVQPPAPGEDGRPGPQPRDVGRLIPSPRPADGVPVLGVDGCRDGWVGVVPGSEGTRVWLASGFAGLIEAVTAECGPPGAVAVDMPVGLPDSGRRQADVLARAALGTRWATIFLTPVREALECADHAEATATNRRLAGEGVSRQAHGLRRKIAEVEEVVRAGTHAVHEAHPELCFARLAGAPLVTSKKTWSGAHQRLRLLDDAGIRLRGDLGPAGRAAVDDVLDAAAVAWTAQRVLTGRARSLPDPPQVHADGLPAAIWT